jgi:hypothetical protein
MVVRLLERVQRWSFSGVTMHDDVVRERMVLMCRAGRVKYA